MKRVTAVLAVLVIVACADPAPSSSAAQQPPPAERPVPPPAAPPTPSVTRLYGHFPYAEAPRDVLRAGACSGAGERRLLRPDAADALARMREAARRDGVALNPSSCFRTVASQRALFNCINISSGAGCRSGRQLDPAKRAEAVAPPGHSEHHTGFAIDFVPTRADVEPGVCPTAEACTLKAAFGRSRSGRWLAAHAHEHGFEQSFFANSGQGVTVEPWHYRFVGSEEAAATFRDARAEFMPPNPGR
jgi:zinc D-Ala-D-Ala carboxypeptidase